MLLLRNIFLMPPRLFFCLLQRFSGVTGAGKDALICIPWKKNQAVHLTSSFNLRSLILPCPIGWWCQGWKQFENNAPESILVYIMCVFLMHTQFQTVLFPGQPLKKSLFLPKGCIRGIYFPLSLLFGTLASYLVLPLSWTQYFFLWCSEMWK